MHHRLSPIYGDNVLITNLATLIAGIMESYQPDVAKWIEREIHNLTVSIDIALAFPQ